MALKLVVVVLNTELMSIFLNNTRFNDLGWNFLTLRKTAWLGGENPPHCHQNAVAPACFWPRFSKLGSDAGRLFYFTLNPTHFKSILWEELHSPGGLWYFSCPLSVMSKMVLGREPSARLVCVFPNRKEFLFIHATLTNYGPWLKPLLNETKQSLPSKVLWNKIRLDTGALSNLV